MSPAIDEATQERRRLLLHEIYQAIGDVMIDEADGRLDLASVVFSIGLSIANDELGPAGVAAHLEQLAGEWRAKARAAVAELRRRPVH